jgi:hypothetical protein
MFRQLPTESSEMMLRRFASDGLSRPSAGAGDGAMLGATPNLAHHTRFVPLSGEGSEFSPAGGNGGLVTPRFTIGVSSGAGVGGGLLRRGSASGFDVGVGVSSNNANAALAAAHHAAHHGGGHAAASPGLTEQDLATGPSTFLPVSPAESRRM